MENAPFKLDNAKKRAGWWRALRGTDKRALRVGTGVDGGWLGDWWLRRMFEFVVQGGSGCD